MGNQLPKYNDNNEYGLNVYVITDDSNFKKETLEEIFNIKIPMSEVSFSCTQSNLYDSPIMPNLKVNHFGVFPSENIPDTNCHTDPLQTWQDSMHHNRNQLRLY